MKSWRKRVGRSLSPKPLLAALFLSIEQKSPRFASWLRYHSQIEEIGRSDEGQTLQRSIRAFEAPYRQQLDKIIGTPRSFEIYGPNSEVPIITAFRNNVEIHGHIKVPVSANEKRALGIYFPWKSLPWGEVYPLPLRITSMIDGDAIFVPRMNNVFHLLVEYIIPAVSAVLRNNNTINNLTIVSQVKYPILEVIANFLNEIGIRTSIKYINIFDKVIVERLILSRARSFDQAYDYAFAEEMQCFSNYLDGLVHSIEVPEICYIRRTKTPRRNVINEHNLIDELKKYSVGIEEFSFENCLRQIAVFRKSRLIISGHGAAFSNIIFSKKGLSILEIFPFDTRPRCFLNLASQHGLDYSCLFGSISKGNNDYEAPINEIIDFVKKFKMITN
jgi:hypothetical protein